MDSPGSTITLTLTAEEESLIAALARERGLDSPADVLRALLHEVIEADEGLWDAQFAASQDLLNQLAGEALEDFQAGRTDIWDPDDDPEAPDDL